MLTKELAQAAMAFLSRCDLKGAEAPTMSALMHALDALLKAPAPLQKVPGDGA